MFEQEINKQLNSYSVSKEEALNRLDSFISYSRNKIKSLEINNQTLDTFESLEKLYHYIGSNINANYRKTTDPNVPEFIRETQSFKENNFEFDFETKALIIVFGFALGEFLIRQYPTKLKWGVGMKDYVQENKPVVLGFNNKIEMEICRVSNVLFMKYFKGNKNELESIIKIWIKDV